jgi:hypothetical protein
MKWKVFVTLVEGFDGIRADGIRPANERVVSSGAGSKYRRQNSLKTIESETIRSVCS